MSWVGQIIFSLLVKKQESERQTDVLKGHIPVGGRVGKNPGFQISGSPLMSGSPGEHPHTIHLRHKASTVWLCSIAMGSMKSLSNFQNYVFFNVFYSTFPMQFSIRIQSH